MLGGWLFTPWDTTPAAPKTEVDLSRDRFVILSNTLTGIDYQDTTVNGITYHRVTPETTYLPPLLLPLDGTPPQSQRSVSPRLVPQGGDALRAIRKLLLPLDGTPPQSQRGVSPRLVPQGGDALRAMEILLPLDGIPPQSQRGKQPNKIIDQNNNPW
jgi:hypothetical protein